MLPKIFNLEKKNQLQNLDPNDFEKFVKLSEEKIIKLLQEKTPRKADRFRIRFYVR